MRAYDLYHICLFQDLVTIIMKMEFSSQRREMLLFLTTKMVAVMSSANQAQRKSLGNGFWFELARGSSYRESTVMILNGT